MWTRRVASACSAVGCRAASAPCRGAPAGRRAGGAAGATTCSSPAACAAVCTARRRAEWPGPSSARNAWRNISMLAADDRRRASLRSEPAPQACETVRPTVVGAI